MKKRKWIILGALICLASVMLSGCGNSNQDAEQGNVEEVTLPEYTYVAEYETIETTDYLGQVLFADNGLVYTKSGYDEETGISDFAFCKYDLETKITTELPIVINENEYVSQMFLGQNNRLLIITQLTDYMKENPITQFFVYEYNFETDEVIQTEITEQMQTGNEYVYIQYAAMDTDGKLYFATGDSVILVLDKEYNIESSIMVPNYISAMGVSKNNELIISSYTDDGKNIIQTYDASTKSFSEGNEINFYFYYQNSLVPGMEKDFMIKTDTGILEYSIADNTTTEVVNFINSDINGDGIQNFIGLEDGRIVLFSEDWNTDPASYELVYLTKTKTSELPVKELISLKTLYLNYDLKGKIIEFNKTNPKYRIIVETYDLTDYEAAITKYQTDLATGKASDIIDISNSNIIQLANKGILEDLYPYIDEDSEFNKEDFFANVLEAYTVNEELCAIVPTVNIMTMIGKTKFVGEEAGWRPADIVELAQSLPEETELFEYGSKEQVLSMLVSYDLDSYINWETGECNFASDEFVDLMKFANEFPTQEDIMALYETSYAYDMENTEDKIAKDTLILLQGYFSNLYDYQYTMARFNEPAICVGFPSVEGSGTFIGGSGVALGMNAGSNKKEGVWEFIRYFLTEEASENAWGLPVNKKAYAKMLEENMTPTYFENPEDIYIPLEKQKITEDGRVEMPVNTIYYGDTEEYLYAASQEEADAFTTLYESTNSLATYDMEILNILLEEADSYFSGQKNVEAVADIIQSRLQIYVNENK